jgi:hypothetical protein
MATWDEIDDDDDDETPTTDPADQLPEPARKAMRRMEKQLKQQSELLDKYQQRERESAVVSVLKEKGLPEKVAALVPSTVESTPDAVKAWLAEWEDVLGGSIATGSPEDSSPVVDESTAAAIAGINNFGQGGSLASEGLPTTPEGMEAAIRATKNRDELYALLKQLPAGR